MHIHFKYLITGIILCWSLVGFPIVTNIALWLFLLFVYLIILKLFLRTGLSSILSVLLATPCLVLVILNTRSLTIYQDIFSEQNKIEVKKKYTAYPKHPLRVITNTDYIYAFKSSYSFLEYGGKKNLKDCNDFSLKDEECHYWKEYVKNIKGFNESNIEEGVPTLIVNHHNAWGSSLYSYKLLDDDKKVIATARFRQRNGFSFESNGRIKSFDDKNISSFDYLFRKNPLTQALEELAPKQSSILLSEFISRAFKFEKVKTATNKRRQKASDFDVPPSFITKEHKHLSRKLIKEVTLTKPLEIESPNQSILKSVINKLKLDDNVTYDSCNDYLSPNPNLHKNIWQQYIKFRSPNSNKVSIHSNPTVLCFTEGVLVSNLADIYPYPFITLKYFNHSGQLLDVYDYTLRKDAIERFAIPLYNTIKHSRDYFSVSWAMTQRLEDSYHELVRGNQQNNFNFKDKQSKIGLPQVPLLDSSLNKIEITKLFTTKYYRRELVNGTVRKNNTSPIANADTITVPQSGILPLNDILIENDKDADNDKIDVTGVFGAFHGTLKETGKRNFSYIAPSTLIGNDSFKYRISDYDTKLKYYIGGGDWNLVMIDIVKNSSPIAVDDEFTAMAGEQIIMKVTNNDIDNESDHIFIDSVNGLNTEKFEIRNNKIVFNVPDNTESKLYFKYVIKEINKETGLRTTNTSVGNVLINIMKN